MKEFKLSSWSIDNKTSIYVATLIITLAGIMSYIGLPKEQFPEIVFPQILVSTIYPGAGPTDIENTISQRIEKEVKAIAGVKKVTSSSVQDFSLVNIEFNTDVDVPKAKQLVKDAVDKAKKDLPKDIPGDPNVIEIQTPIGAISKNTTSLDSINSASMIPAFNMQKRKAVSIRLTSKDPFSKVGQIKIIADLETRPVFLQLTYLFRVRDGSPEDE
mgnify:CR=1 FL=1